MAMDKRPRFVAPQTNFAFSVNFNHNSSCFCVGLESGFQVYETDRCILKATKDTSGGIGQGVLLDQTSYIFLVGGGKRPKFSECKFAIYDYRIQKFTGALRFSLPILRLRPFHTHIAISTYNAVEVARVSGSPERVCSFETADNPHGLVDFQAKWLAFPGRTEGQVQLVEMDTDKGQTGKIHILPAHSGALSAVHLSQDGKLLATAGQRGTLIRVFSTESRTKVAELRRGVDIAGVFSIGINPAKTQLAVTSDKGTLHLFDLPKIDSRKKTNKQQSQPPHQSQLEENQPASLLEYDENIESESRNKWGILSSIPFLPRIFKDTYSAASARFETGDGPSEFENQNPYNVLPTKGQIGWISDDELVIVSSGSLARWEKFAVRTDDLGRLNLVKLGWKRFLER